MRLISILSVMDDNDNIKVIDENKPINKAILFDGNAGDCIKQGYFRNGVVTSLFANNSTLIVTVNIEYQKKRAAQADGYNTQ